MLYDTVNSQAVSTRALCHRHVSNDHRSLHHTFANISVLRHFPLTFKVPILYAIHKYPYFRSLSIHNLQVPLYVNISICSTRAKYAQELIYPHFLVYDTDHPQVPVLFVTKIQVPILYVAVYSRYSKFTSLFIYKCP